MAMNDDATLGCGRTVDDVWANLDRPADPHERTCPDCTAARRALRNLQQVTTTYRETERDADADPDPTLHPRPRVLENVMAIARAEVRRSRQLPVTVTGHGPILIGEQTLLALVRHAIDSVPTTRARRLRVFTTPDGKLSQLICRLAVSVDTVIPDTAAEIRHRIATILRDHLNLNPDAIDLIVEDLYDR